MRFKKKIWLPYIVSSILKEYKKLVITVVTKENDRVWSVSVVATKCPRSDKTKCLGSREGKM